MQPTRRDILTALLGLPIGLACARKSPAAEFDGGFADDLAQDGHRLREAFLPEPSGAPEEIPVLILGGGVAGLAAGRRLLARGLDRFRIVELASAPGGTARSGRSSVTAYPWGAHYVPAPSADNPELLELFREAGCFSQDDLQFRETDLVVAPKERVFFRGEWHKGLYPPCDGEDLKEYHRFEAIVGRLARQVGADGRRAFTLPTAACSEDPEILALDRITMSEWLDRERFRSPLLRWYADYACRDDFGLSAERTSAWYGLHYFASRVHLETEESAEFLTWPEGNGFLVDFLVKRIGAARFLSDSLCVRVAPEGDGRRARVLVFDRKKKSARSFVAERVIFALPSFLRSRVIAGFEVAAYQPHYAPWLVANVHLSERPRSRGFEPAWDNVIHGSRSLGYVIATHQTGPDFGPTVWTYYLPFPDEDDRRARASLLSLSFEDAAGAVVAELDRAHQGFSKAVRRIDVMRWGHGMVQPRPGMRTDPERARAGRPAGPIHFAHGDLSGVALFEEAFFQGQRAADEVAAALGVSG